MTYEHLFVLKSEFCKLTITLFENKSVFLILIVIIENVKLFSPLQKKYLWKDYVKE